MSTIDFELVGLRKLVNASSDDEDSDVIKAAASEIKWSRQKIIYLSRCLEEETRPKHRLWPWVLATLFILFCGAPSLAGLILYLWPILQVGPIG